MKQTSKRIWSLLLVAALALTLLPAATVFATNAADGSGSTPGESICTHIHDESCGYAERADCGHIHDEDCGEDGADCIHTHDEDCGYIEAAPCAHVHDEDCGGLDDGQAVDSDSPPSGPSLGYSSITAFAPLDADVAGQQVTTGTPLADLELPDALAATVEDEDGNQEQGDIPVARWSAAPDYDPQEIGTYTFTPELAAGYTLEDGAALPEITVRVAVPVAMARMDGSVDITGKSVAAVSAEIDAALAAAGSGDTVTVTGELTGVSGGVAFTIPDGVRVIWQATLTGSIPSGSLIETGDNGTFVLAGGLVENSGDGNAIYAAGPVEVRGGEVTGAGDTAVAAEGNIEMHGGKVTATGIYGNALVSTNEDVVIHGGEVIATGEEGLAVGATGSADIQGGTVLSLGADGLAVYAWQGAVTVSGGLVFALGDAIVGPNNVIYEVQASSFTAPTGDGVVIAWNAAAGNAVYTVGTATDLTCLPADSAVWAEENGEHGIAYVSGAGEGFLTLPVAVVEAGAQLVSTYLDLEAQLADYATAGEDVAIILAPDFPTDGMTAAFTVPGNAGGRSLTLRSANPATPAEITRDGAVTGHLFTVEIGAHLILQDVVVDGGKGGGVTATGALVNIEGGALTLRVGAVLRNNDNTATGAGGVDVVSKYDSGAYRYGVFTLEGGKISGNNGGKGGGVRVTSGCTITMRGGEISGNSASSDGGGMYLREVPPFTMEGGTITGNSAGSSGGGVYLVGSTLTIRDGEISQNTAASSSGGVYVGTSSTFTLEGGRITGNAATSQDGGGVYVRDNGTFALRGGEISGNTATHDGSGVYLYNQAALQLRGAPVFAGNGVYARQVLSSHITVDGDLSPDALILIEGSNQANQMTSGAVVAEKTGGGALTGDKALCFRSLDGTLMGQASGSQVLWADTADLLVYATNAGTSLTAADYDYSGGVLTVKSGTPMTIRNLDPDTPTTDRIVVQGGVAVNLTLAGVNIDTYIDPATSGSAAPSPFDIGAGATAHLTLQGDNTLKNDYSSFATLHVPEGAGLTVTAASTGSLKAGKANGGRGACIGGNAYENAGAITIAGGTVKAANNGVNAAGAGIGGGIAGDGGAITITGGTVSSESVSGAGIGGGNSGGSGGSITIEGGTVTATSREGAAIGGGSGISGGSGGGSGGTITIKGGAVDAVSVRGAGIGGGYSQNSVGGSGGNITIEGGMVDAVSDMGAGIGGGYSQNSDGGSGGTITITGGAVNAVSDSGAGFGGGFSFSGTGGSGGRVAISGAGATVTAKTTSAYSVGSGYGRNSYGSGGSLSVSAGATLNLEGSGTNAALNGSIGPCTITDDSNDPGLDASWTGNIGGVYSPLTVNGGTAGWSDAQESYWQPGILRDGVTVNLTAPASDQNGAPFTGWTSGSAGVDFVGVSGTSASFTMPANPAEATATYAGYHSITVQTQGSGSAQADRSAALQGTTVTLTATPNSGHRFVEWQVVSGGISITDNRFTMPDSDVSVRAVFEEIPGGGASGSGRSSSSGGNGGSNQGSPGKTAIPASAFTWDGAGTLRIDHGDLGPQGMLGVWWDGEPTDAYLLSAGSVVIRFDEAFLAAQAPGPHTIRVEFWNHAGEVSVALGETGQLEESTGDPVSTTGGTDNPNTGDGRSIWPVLLLGCLSGFVLVVRRLKPVA